MFYTSDQKIYETLDLCEEILKLKYSLFCYALLTSFRTFNGSVVRRVCFSLLYDFRMIHCGCFLSQPDIMLLLSPAIFSNRWSLPEESVCLRLQRFCHNVSVNSKPDHSPPGATPGDLHILVAPGVGFSLLSLAQGVLNQSKSSIILKKSAMFCFVS